MPFVKQLVNDTAKAASRPATAQPVAASDPAPEKLPVGEIIPAGEFHFPDGTGPLAVFAGLPALNEPDALPDPEGGGSGPYVAFASSRSPSWPSLQAAGIAEGDPYVAADGQYHEAAPLRFFLVSAAPTYYTKRNTAGNLVAAKREQVYVGDKPQYEEHYLTLVIVDLGDRMVPAKAEFIGTKSGAVVPALRAVKQAATPEWAGLSATHKLTAAFSVPFGRVSCIATTAPRTSKSSGNRYFAGVGSAGPATLDQMQRLNAAFADPTFQALAGAAKESFLDRRALLERLAG